MNTHDTPEPDPDPVWKIIEISEPVEGLDELYEHDRARYANEAAERILGPAGKMIAASKTGYWRQHPDNLPVFNANLCTRERGKVWFGDLDLTRDEPKLAELAHALGEPIYVLYERAARFGNEETPTLDEAVVMVAPDGRVELDLWTVRAPDGRIRPKPVGG